MDRLAADYGPPLLLSEPVRGQYVPRELWRLPGYDQMRLWQERGDEQPHIPLDHLLGIRMEDAGFDRASFVMPASPWLVSATGFILGGMLATVADAALGIAAYVALPGMTAIATAELSMNFVRAATPESGVLRAHGGLIHAGGSLALSDTVVEDGAGKLLAHGTSRVVVTRPRIPQEPVVEIPWEPAARYDTPDPFERRPVVGEVVPQETWDRLG
ncbi:MAG TPA: PaaI family thioesterase, partial [Actinomycetota bacterium]|nr:PaaI family thioesterase [Actinomycetota bacterium]